MKRKLHFIDFVHDFTGLAYLLGEEAVASKHFMARLNGVDAFGYNSVGGEPIWMKFGALRVHCSAAGPDGFWMQSAQKRERESERKLFCSVNNARLCRFPVSQILLNLHI